MEKYTWADRPLIAEIVGQEVVITDIGPDGEVVFVWDGASWRPKEGKMLLSRIDPTAPCHCPELGKKQGFGEGSDAFWDFVDKKHKK